MKERVKKTGEIIEVIQVGTKTHLYDLNNVEFIDAPEDYWTRLEHQYIGMAMQGMLNNSLLTTGLLKAGKSHEDFVDEVTRTALRYAHALVERLKKKEGR